MNHPRDIPLLPNVSNSKDTEKNRGTGNTHSKRIAGQDNTEELRQSSIICYKRQREANNVFLSIEVGATHQKAANQRYDDTRKKEERGIAGNSSIDTSPKRDGSRHGNGIPGGVDSLDDLQNVMHVVKNQNSAYKSKETSPVYKPSKKVASPNYLEIQQSKRVDHILQK